MTDVELLFLVLALVYASECACWLPAQSLAFRTWWGRRWQPTHPSPLLSNQQGGLLFAHPLPPLGTLLAGSQFPLSLSPDAMLAYVPSAVSPTGRPAQTGRLFRFDEIRAIEARGKKVLVNGELLVKAVSPTFAAQLVRRLEQLRASPAAARSRSVKELLRETLDAEAAEQRWQQFQNETTSLRWLANGLFCYLFVIAPVCVWQFGLSRVWPELVAALLAFTISLAVLFRNAHKLFYPDAAEQRFTHFLTVLLSPATAIRVGDLLSRPLLETFHPLALSRLFCLKEQFAEMGRVVLRELTYPALPSCPRPEPAAQAAELFWRESCRKAVENFLERNRLSPGELLAPPVPADAGCISYCPRCLAQFSLARGVCEDCGGLELESFPVKAGALDGRRGD